MRNHYSAVFFFLSSIVITIKVIIICFIHTRFLINLPNTFYLPLLSYRNLQHQMNPNECVYWRFGVSFTYVIEIIDSKLISVCLFNDYYLIADLYIFVLGSADCATISLECTKVKLLILDNFDNNSGLFSNTLSKVIAPYILWYFLLLFLIALSQKISLFQLLCTIAIVVIYFLLLNAIAKWLLFSIAFKKKGDNYCCRNSWKSDNWKQYRKEAMYQSKKTYKQWSKELRATTFAQTKVEVR